ncbi:MAG TPA: YceI family protein [Trebonia sp.]|jgi:polyisoprenoid-binding protein YceI
MAASTGTYRLGPDAGRVVIKTTRAGLAARVGHDLAIDVTRWSADVTVPGDDPSAATVTAELDLGSLTVREGTGGARPLTDSDRRDIESTMRKILGSGGPATAAFRSTRVIPSAAGGAIEGTLTLNGRSQPVRLQLTTPAPGRYRGTVTIVQSAFGIKPYSGFFGALKLRDEVVAEFEVDLGRAG